MITVELDNFSLKEICQSGQCFRMRETEENTYELIAGDQYLKLTQEGTIVTFYCSDVEFLCYWVPYFDLDADYGGYIEKINPRDRYLCAAAASGSGIMNPQTGSLGDDHYISDLAAEQYHQDPWMY